MTELARSFREEEEEEGNVFHGKVRAWTDTLVTIFCLSLLPRCSEMVLTSCDSLAVLWMWGWGETGNKRWWTTGESMIHDGGHVRSDRFLFSSFSFFCIALVSDVWVCCVCVRACVFIRQCDWLEEWRTCCCFRPFLKLENGKDLVLTLVNFASKW